LLGLRVIASEHSNFKVSIKSFPIWFVKRHIYPHANFLTVLTERDKSEYYGRFMKNVVVMLNPLSLVPVKNVNLLKREKIILSIGEVPSWRIKGFDNLLEIFLKISVQYPDWKLVIIGRGDQSYLLDIIQKSNLAGRVSLPGEIKNVQTFMQLSSIYALPSRWEGLPMVLIEAMSQGMACIAFDCFTGPGDIITNRLDGILIEDQDINQFVCGLSELIENQDLRLSLGTNAIETSKKYLPEKIVKRWRNLIENPSAFHE
jgi:glycosyltransferase involved in cell wall biosynthesis